MTTPERPVTSPGDDAATAPNDAELIGHAFAALFDRHAVAVHRYLARRCGSAVADDLLSQTFLVAYEGRARYDRSRPDARPWLYGIATNLLRRHVRTETRQLAAWARSGSDPTTDVMADGADRIAERADAQLEAPRLAAALADLNPGDRDALLLLAWGELTYSEIALALDIPVGTVRSRLNRARDRVRRALPDQEGTRS